MSEVLTDVDALRRRLAQLPRPLGLVPTMGALHDGHVSLVAAARRGCAAVVVSIFVNPLQFGAGEDFDRYPRDLDADLARLAEADVDVVFTPSVTTFTPADRRTRVTVEGVTSVLEGASRPGHFDGVATIVAKLFNTVQPDRAYFGEKDFQQLAVIRQMVRDLNQPVEVIGCPIVREPDGLAMSSRNVYLSPDERAAALALSRELRAVAEAWRGDATAAQQQLSAALAAAPGVELDYAEVVDPGTLEPLRGMVAGPAQALVAARVGATRLIDNCRLGGA